MRIELGRHLLRHEVRVLGPWIFALPVMAAAVLAVTLAMMGLRQASPTDIRNVVLAALEGTLPLVAGIATANVVSGEPALELQLALLVPYRLTVLRRITLLLIWTGLIEVLSVALVASIWPWTLNREGVAGYLLTWLAPLLWFSAWGAVLSLLLGGRAASVAVLGVVWTVELLFHGLLAAYGWTRSVYVFATMFNPVADYWGTNRLELLLTATVLYVAVWWYLGDGEALFTREEG